MSTLNIASSVSGGAGGSGGNGGAASGSPGRGGNGGTGGNGGHGLYNLGTITTLTNTGSIQGGSGGSGGFRGVGTTQPGSPGSPGSSGNGIFNNTVITTFNNLQGASSTALNYRGNLPTNYNIIVSSASNYGKLLGVSASGTTNFGISSLSTSSTSILNTSLTSVLAGISGSSINVVGGTNTTINNVPSWSATSNGYSYTLSMTGVGTNIWNLMITACSVCNGGSTPTPTPTPTPSDSTAPTPTTSVSSTVSTGTSTSLSSLSATSSPVLAGGALLLTKGERSSQAISVQTEGGTLVAPTTGAAQLSGVLSGVGRIIFSGTGTTVVSGANTYTGGTTVSEGTLSLLGGTLGFGEVYVAPGAQLVGTGTIAGALTVAGLFKPGNSPGYIASSASVNMNNGSVYQQDIAGTSQASEMSPVGATGYYSYLNITGGQFIINAGATLTPALSNLFNSLESGYGSAPYTPVLGDRFRIVTADGGISGKFSSVTQPAELSAGTQLLPFYNMMGSNSIDLAVIPTSYKYTIAATAGNKNAQSVGTALDAMVASSQTGTSSGMQDQLLYATSVNNAASLAAYAQGLAGEVYSAAVAVIAQTTQRVQQAVLTRLGDTMGIGLPNSMTLPAGNTALMASANAVQSGGVASAAVSSNPNVNPSTENRSLFNGNVWGDLAYQKGNRSSDSNSGGWNSNLYQLVFGSDFYTTQNIKVGGGIALSSTTLNPTDGSGTIQQGSVFAYGKMPVDAYIVDAMASFGLNSSDLSRSDVTGLSNGFRNKSISGNDAMVSLGVSRPIDMDDFRFTPYARVTWQMVTQSGVVEGSSASALSVNSFTGNGVRGVLGIAAGSRANDPMTEKYTYRAYVGVGADSSGVLNPTLNASLAGIGTSINTPNAGSTFLQVGLYGTAKVSDNAYAFAGLSGEARSGQTLAAVNVGVRIQF
ncbi:MAG: autotransporter domain-containing protein [Sheuella sp.]|nr:autotransporter domain-containing protein [Sheuella sp.]